MTEDIYRPLVDRERKPKSRVHEELTQSARERLTAVTDDWGRARIASQNKHKRYKSEALREVIKFVGKSPIYDAISDSAREEGIVALHNEFILNGKTTHVLTYVENLAIKDKTSYRSDSKQRLRARRGEIQHNSQFSDLYNILITEGILWELEWAEQGGVIEFQPMESEAMADIDSKVQALAGEEPWDTALEGYNAAFERYLSGDFDDNLVKKLYYSIEETLQIICVDLEDWTDDREKSHGDYLNILRDKGVYNANGITTPELNQLLDSLEKLVNKVGNDRKQRHAYHDRAYCTLLIHQVGAYLYFLISRYDNFPTGASESYK